MELVVGGRRWQAHGWFGFVVFGFYLFFIQDSLFKMTSVIKSPNQAN